MKLSMHKDFPEKLKEGTEVNLANAHATGFNKALSLLGQLEVLEPLDEPAMFQTWLEEHKAMNEYEAFTLRWVCQRFGIPAVDKTMNIHCDHKWSITNKGLECSKCGDVIDIKSSAVGTGKQMTPLQWFMTPNPLLGNVSPIEMIHNGRGEKLCKWIENQVDENNHTLSPARSEVDEKKLADFLLNLTIHPSKYPHVGARLTFDDCRTIAKTISAFLRGSNA